jgi:hypothetical protein
MAKNFKQGRFFKRNFLVYWGNKSHRTTLRSLNVAAEKYSTNFNQWNI